MANPKTSVSHPLQIQTVTPPGTSGTIGMTLCPGRRGASLENGWWDRDLALDLDAVRAWRPDLVIALLEEHEYATLGIPAFRRDVLAAGLPWEFTEIRDGCAPDERFSRVWETTLGPRVRAILREGGRVLVHCRAGLGRTGMLAAGLLVEFGEEPETAIAAVRASRSIKAVESREQERWVASRRRIA